MPYVLAWSRPGSPVVETGNDAFGREKPGEQIEPWEHVRVLRTEECDSQAIRKAVMNSLLACRTRVPG